MNSKVIREKIADLHGEMNTLSAKLKEEKRNKFTTEEREQFDALDKQQEDFQEQLETVERLERFDGLTRQNTDKRFRERVLDDSVSERAVRSEVEERNKAYAGWFFHGTEKQKPEYWRAAERAGIDVTSRSFKFAWNPWTKDEQRSAQASNPGTAGGYTIAVDNQLMTQYDRALKFFGNLFQIARVVTTPTGAPLPWFTVDDTSSTGEIVGENGTVNEGAISVGQRQLSAFKYDSKMIKIPWELENDSIVSLAGLVGELAGERIARKLNSDMIQSGDGLNTPTPLTATATSSGVTTASNSAVTYSEILQLYHSVDVAYRDRPSTCFLFHDDQMKSLRGLVDGNQRPLLNSSLEGISGNVPVSMKTLLEKPYYINNGVPTGASAKAWFFGDFSKLIIRRVGGEGADSGLNLLKLIERFADVGQVAYFAWARYDSYLSDAGTHPVKYMTNHS